MYAAVTAFFTEIAIVIKVVRPGMFQDKPAPFSQ